MEQLNGFSERTHRHLNNLSNRTASDWLALFRKELTMLNSPPRLLCILLIVSVSQLHNSAGAEIQTAYTVKIPAAEVYKVTPLPSEDAALVDDPWVETASTPHSNNETSAHPIRTVQATEEIGPALAAPNMFPESATVLPRANTLNSTPAFAGGPTFVGPMVSDSGTWGSPGSEMSVPSTRRGCAAWAPTST